MFTSLCRITKFAWQNISRNFWLSMVTVSILILTLFSISFVLFLNVLSREAFAVIKNKIDVSVSFKPEIAPADVLAVQENLEKVSYIKEIKFQSRADVLSDFQKKHQTDQPILDSLKELANNPFGDNLIIKAQTIKDYPLILTALEQSQYKNLIAEKIYDNNNVFLNKMDLITNKIKKLGLAITLIFSLITVLVMFNTIRITIYTHSEEIAIMKLVGASNWFIRAPFLLESFIYAVLGALATMILLYPVLNIIEPYIAHLFDYNFSLLAYYTTHLAQIFFWQAAGVLILNIIASTVAVSKYLKV